MSYRYREIIFDSRLNKSKTILGNTKKELETKKELQYMQWDEQWERIYNKQVKIANDEHGVATAQKKTQEAEQLQDAINNLFVNSLEAGPFIIDELLDKRDLNEIYPKKENYKDSLREPQLEDEKYKPKISFIDKLLRKTDQINDACYELYNADHDEWILEVHKYNQAIRRWKEEKESQAKTNNEIEEVKRGFYLSEKAAVEKYAILSLESINIPVDYDEEFDVEYVPDSRTVVVEAWLPTIDDMPTLKSVSYVKVRQELKKTYYSEAYLKKQYDGVIYQMVLSFINDMFSINVQNDLVDNVVLNGRVNTIDKATGKDISPCILSVRVGREQFEELNLYNVDPKAWFRKTKGISAANIAVTTPVNPIQTISRSDKRFVEGYEVLSSVGEGDNIAAMDWQDFENLVRELFEEEFSVNGGEVKITQASRDGGVDAVAFDPDPIRGGKIIIQAKRYTNVVGVSAVRDLYGTLLNEGAMKGILVTTSYYGNDAYEFAKGKPLQLIDGGGLLELMRRHGQKARIDLTEAKQILKDLDS